MGERPKGVGPVAPQGHVEADVLRCCARMPLRSILWRAVKTFCDVACALQVGGSDLLLPCECDLFPVVGRVTAEGEGRERRHETLKARGCDCRRTV